MMLIEDLEPVLSRRTAPHEGSKPCLARSARTRNPLGTLQIARSQENSVAGAAKCDADGPARRWSSVSPV
jgi:hypothetical protein